MNSAGVIYRALCAKLEKTQRVRDEVDGVVKQTRRKHDSNSRCVLQTQSAIDYMRPHPLITTCEQERMRNMSQQAIN